MYEMFFFIFFICVLMAVNNIYTQILLQEFFYIKSNRKNMNVTKYNSNK